MTSKGVTTKLVEHRRARMYRFSTTLTDISLAFNACRAGALSVGISDYEFKCFDLAIQELTRLQSENFKLTEEELSGAANKLKIDYRVCEQVKSIVVFVANTIMGNIGDRPEEASFVEARKAASRALFELEKFTQAMHAMYYGRNDGLGYVSFE